MSGASACTATNENDDALFLRSRQQLKASKFSGGHRGSCIHHLPPRDARIACRRRDFDQNSTRTGGRLAAEAGQSSGRIFRRRISCGRIQRRRL